MNYKDHYFYDAIMILVLCLLWTKLLLSFRWKWKNYYLDAHRILTTICETYLLTINETSIVEEKD